MSETFSYFVDNAPAASLPLAGNIPIVQADGKTHQFPASAISGAISIVVRVFTSTGTYTPTAGMIYCIAEGVGGGGGGCSGGTSGSASGIFEGGGGGGGEYARKILSATQIGASQAVIIGALGTGGASGGNNGGNNGGNTSLGSLLVAIGGNGAAFSGTGGNGGHGGTGDVLIQGDSGGTGRIASIDTISAVTPLGGASKFGTPGTATGVLAGANNGANANAEGYGAGGNGAAVNGSASSAAGGNGRPGILIITEFIEA
jgi:hypothetical protein